MAQISMGRQDEQEALRSATELALGLKSNIFSPLTIEEGPQSEAPIYFLGVRLSK